MIKKIIKNFIYIIIIGIIICNIAVIIQKIVNPQKNPNLFGIEMFCIVSGSMEPDIKINDIVVVKKVPKSEINKDDIISFTINGETVTHRITNIETNENGETLYTTKGDANNVEDEEKIRYENIEGKCIGKIPKIGKLILLFK